MKVVQGWYLPNSDSHMEQYFRAIGKPEYQPAHRATAVSYCDKFRVALDIGAHVGLWARDLTDRFDTVFAFEPCPEYAELLTKNAPKAVVHRYALGSCEKSVLLVGMNLNCFTAVLEVRPNKMAKNMMNKGCAKFPGKAMKNC